MIAALNRLVELIEDDLTEELDVAELTARLGTTEHHVRRMFSSLAGMPLSEYIRRRRMTRAAADVVGGGAGCTPTTARPRRSAGRSAPCTASAPPTCVATAGPFDHNRSSGSA